MEFVERAPSPRLRDCVESIFHLRGYSPPEPIERIVPDGSINLVIELDGKERAVLDPNSREPLVKCVGSWISGVHQSHFLIAIPTESELLAVRLAPGSALPLVGKALSNFTDRVVAASEAFGPAIESLRSELLSTSTPSERLEIVDDYLARTYKSELEASHELTTAVGAIVDRPVLGTLSNLHERVGFSDTHLVTLFRRHVGVAPKAFQRIMRFFAAVHRIQSRETVAWSEVSADCGYSDQSHFIRDFSRYSGLKPTEFLDRKTDRINFFPEA